ncbi:MAG: hypothetical protein HeimC3_26820 [Candidatus Heimdallarchaeota archaeon LC_3]|nr:MAG: hypothetical protein HeimC3_26820 [Candidatus Heimdallarchaeota archaeon LC_3]
MFEFNSIERKLNGFTREWRSIQNSSLKSTNSILGLISKLNLVKTKQYSEQFSQFPDIQDRLISILIDQINIKLPEIQKTVNEFSKLGEKIKNWEDITTKLLKNEMKKSFILNESEGLINEIRIIEQTLEQVKEIASMFEIEISLRHNVFDLIQNISKEQFSVQKLSFYLTVWTSEPYLDFNRINEIIENFVDLTIEESDIKNI